MGIKKDWAKDLQMQMQQKVVAVLSKVGEDTIRFVRDRDAEDSWYDQTGNLRSSIGYGVAVKGKMMHDGGFETTISPEGDGTDGKSVGAEVLKKAIDDKGMELVVVAGMEYASFVEAKENKDVLASGELFARDKARKLLKMIRLK